MDGILKLQALMLAAARCLGLSGVGGAEPSLPTSPAGKALRVWLDSFNNADADGLREYLEARYPTSQRSVGDWIGLRRHTGAFDLQAIEDSSGTKLAVIAKARGWDEFARLMIEVESKPPYCTTALTARLIPRPVAIASPTRLTERQLLSILPGKLERAATDDHFSGAVMIAKAGTPIYSAAFGCADRERKIPNTVETKFRIGSMNKLFTAVAVLQQVQGGRIGLSDSIGTYLPDYPNPNAGAKLTIHHLLSHTGGTGDIFGPDFMAHREDLRELADYVTLYGKPDLLFEPGSRWDYSNYGFVLLGVVIERVTGESYYDVVRNAIFDPAGMTATDSLPETTDVPGRSVGYSGTKLNSDTLPYRGTSAGGGYSTVGDLARFADALASNRLLNPEYTALAMTGKVDTGWSGSKYAYGFFDTSEDGTRYIGHGGVAPGMSGELRIFLTSGYVVAVLSNIDPPAASRVAGFIGARLPAD
jgi:CubicO group peptidase (beta-lactamase class C family)